MFPLLRLVSLSVCALAVAPAALAAPAAKPLATGEALFAKKDWTGAEKALSRAIEEGAKKAGAYHLRGLCRRRLGRDDAAAEDFKAALSKNPRFAPAHRDLGVLLAQKGKKAPAARHLRLAVRFAPKDGSSWYELGRFEEQRKRAARAIRAYRRAIKRAPDKAGYHLALGRALLAASKLALAIKRLEQAAKIDPKRPETWRLLARAHLQKKDYAGALAVLARAQKHLPQDAALVCEAGKVHERASRINDALRAYRRCAKLDASYAEAHLLLGGALRAKGLCQLAVRAYATYAVKAKASQETLNKLVAPCRGRTGM